MSEQTVLPAALPAAQQPEAEILPAAQAAESLPSAENLPVPQAGESPAAGLMRIIERAVLDPNLDIERIERLLAVKERWDCEEARKTFGAALARAQARMPIVDKNVHVFFEGKSGRADTDYWHAGFGNLVGTIGPVLAAEGLSFAHNVIQDGNEITIECVLTHDDGHSRKVSMTAPPDDTGGKNRIQQIRSTKTYLKRATLEAIAGAATADDDDDGRGAYQDETISASQVAWINAELESLDADRGAFLDYLSKNIGREIAYLEDLPASAFDKASAAIDAKRAKRAREQSDAAAAATEQTGAEAAAQDAG